MTLEVALQALAIVNVLAIAVTGGIIRAHVGARAEAKAAAERAQQRADEAIEKVAELALDIARNYAPNAYVGAVESRIMDQLRSLNAKLDRLLMQDSRESHG